MRQIKNVYNPSMYQREKKHKLFFLANLKKKIVDLKPEYCY